jgi:hypothetical protein
MIRVFGPDSQAHNMSTIAMISNATPFVAIAFAVGSFAFHLHFKNAKKNSLLSEAEFLSSFVRRDTLLLIISFVLPLIKMIYYYDFILKTLMNYD